MVGRRHCITKRGVGMEPKEPVYTEEERIHDLIEEGL